MSDTSLSQRLPTADEIAAASDAVTALGRSLTSIGTLPIRLKDNDDEVVVELPPSIGQMLMDLLAHIARGQMVTIVPHGAILTTQEAADLLNVSRPFLTRLLESGEIDFHRVGSHRRLRSQDVLAYRDRRDRERADSLRELQRLGQEIDAD